jgi:IMP cyclohydrolase
MYIGRIVCVARTHEGRFCGAYRVSSRSFPNRRAVISGDKVSIVPKPGHETDVQKNPYVSYNCLRLVCDGCVAVLSNGSHTDPIAEKIAAGMSVRDAMVLSLATLDYEKDAYNTPRICAVADRRNSGSAWLGIVREDGLEVCRMPLTPGRFCYVATYEENHVSEIQSGEFPAQTASESCKFLLTGGLFAQRENPITAVAAVATASGFELTAEDFTGSQGR